MTEVKVIKVCYKISRPDGGSIFDLNLIKLMKPLPNANEDSVISIRKENDKSIILKVIKDSKSERMLQELKEITVDEIPVHVTLMSPQSSIFSSSKNVVGIINGKDLAATPIEELKKKHLPPNVVKFERLTSFDNVTKQIKNTNNYKVTFDNTTTLLPPFISICSLKFKTRLFYPTPQMCYKCMGYGHATKSCKEKLEPGLCLNCGHPREGGPKHICTRKPVCPNCKTPNNNHEPISPSCPARIAEITCIRISANKNLTMPEARQQLRDAQKPSKSSTVTTNTTTSQQQQQLHDTQKPTTSRTTTQQQQQRKQQQQQAVEELNEMFEMMPGVDEETSHAHTNTPTNEKRRLSLESTQNMTLTPPQKKKGSIIYLDESESGSDDDSNTHTQKMSTTTKAPSVTKRELWTYTREDLSNEHTRTKPTMSDSEIAQIKKHLDKNSRSEYKKDIKKAKKKGQTLELKKEGTQIFG